MYISTLQLMIFTNQGIRGTEPDPKQIHNGQKNSHL